MPKPKASTISHDPYAFIGTPSTGKPQPLQPAEPPPAPQQAGNGEDHHAIPGGADRTCAQRRLLGSHHSGQHHGAGIGRRPRPHGAGQGGTLPAASQRIARRQARRHRQKQVINAKHETHVLLALLAVTGCASGRDFHLDRRRFLPSRDAPAGGISTWIAADSCRHGSHDREPSAYMPTPFPGKPSPVLKEFVTPC